LAENKKYFWLKLKDDFFKTKEIKKLRKIAGGDTYTIIYLKMQLLSIKNEGKLYFEGIEDNFIDELSLELDEPSENIEITLNYLKMHNLIEESTTDSYLLPKVLSSIGKESDSAERVRKHRASKEEEKKLLQCNKQVTNCNTEKEKEIYIELDKEIHAEKENIPYKEIIDYLNLKAGTNYKYTTNKTKEFIKARFNENFSLEDFKTVINKKSHEWLKDEKMCKFLRPETLFGTKFESYLNEKVEIAKEKKQFTRQIGDYKIQSL